MKKICALLVLVILVLCGGCQKTQEHVCQYYCPFCLRCTNASCQDEACVSKCHGHHFCQSFCLTCYCCTDESCTEFACLSKCKGHHDCVDICVTCGLCKQLECEEQVCQEKCYGHQETPYQFQAGDYTITTEPVVIDTGTFVYHIPQKVYVRGDLQELTDIIVETMEKVSGLTFAGNGYCQEKYTDEKIHLHVNWWTGATYASPVDHVQDMLPEDLFLSSGGVIIHETAHMLMYRQSQWTHGQLLNESISTYTTYLVEKELEETNPTAAYRIGWAQGTAGSYGGLISDYEKLFEHPLEYWFENTFEYSPYENYSIGFLFAAYLHETYGNYTQWIIEFENTYSYREYGKKMYGNSTLEQRVEVLKATYGEDVLDGFYPWLQEDLHRYEYDNNRDITNLEAINFYPVFNGEHIAEIKDIQFEDLYINLETMRTYFEDYWKKDASGLTLVYICSLRNPPLTINLYKEDGSYTTVLANKSSNEIPLDGISYIKLVGTGEIEFAFFEGIDLEGAMFERDIVNYSE